MNENSVNSFCPIKNVVLDSESLPTPYSYIRYVPTFFSVLVNDRMGSKCKATGLQTAISPKIYLLVVFPAREFQQVCWKINAVLGLWYIFVFSWPMGKWITLQTEPHVSSYVKRRERGTSWVGSPLWGCHSPKFWTSQSGSLWWIFFYRVWGSMNYW